MSTSYTTQFEYIEALKRALTLASVPYDVAAGTVAEYTQRFQAGIAAGRSEADIAAEMEDPRRVAASLRHSTDLVAFREQKSVPNFVRLFFACIGLLVFNVFMIIPAMVYAMMLVALCVSSVAIYLVGIAVTSSSLAGVNELTLDGPIRHVVMMKDHRGHDHDDERHGRLHMRVDSDGVLITPGAVPAGEAVHPGTVVLGAGLDGEERTKGAFTGLGMILGGILLALLSMVITRYTWIGMKRYVQMHINLLRTAN